MADSFHWADITADKIIREKGDGGYVAAVLDAPTLYESGFDRECDTVLAVTADEETLTELLRQLFLNGCDGTCLSSLYLYKGEYRLIIVPLIGSELPHHICSEYMTDISSGKNVRCIQEDGIPVCINDVIGKLGGLEERL